MLLPIVVSRAAQRGRGLNGTVGLRDHQVTGDYGTPPLFSVYRTQLLAYTVILVITKAVTTVIVIAMDEVLSSLAKALFSPVSAYPELELTLVMIICPW